MIIVDEFDDILRDENIGPKVTEKLAGNTPKPALLFYKFFEDNLEYKVLNLGDSSEAYFKRAEKLAEKFGIDFEDFRQHFSYQPNVNVCKSPVHEFNTGQDAIIYWGAAMKCLQSFEGPREKAYLDIINEERLKGRFNKLSDLEVHNNIRKRHNQECFCPITDDELKKVITDDILSLGPDGVILTNHDKDTAQIRNVLLTSGLKPFDYCFIRPLDDFKAYERFLTVWRTTETLINN